MVTYVECLPIVEQILPNLTIMSNTFQEKLRNAVACPESKDAKYVLNKLLPVLTHPLEH